MTFILFGLTVVASSMNLLVLRFLTMNTEDERREEIQSAVARSSLRFGSDIFSPNGTRSSPARPARTSRSRHPHPIVQSGSARLSVDGIDAVGVRAVSLLLVLHAPSERAQKVHRASHARQDRSSRSHAALRLGHGQTKPLSDETVQCGFQSARPNEVNHRAQRGGSDVVVVGRTSAGERAARRSPVGVEPFAETAGGAHEPCD